MALVSPTIPMTMATRQVYRTTTSVIIPIMGVQLQIQPLTVTGAVGSSPWTRTEGEVVLVPPKAMR
jgi:hypothetical protein